MTAYITRAKVQVYNNVLAGAPVGKRDVLKVGVNVESNDISRGKYILITSPSKGWVDENLLRRLDMPPQDFPQGGNIRMIIRGDDKPRGLKPEGANLGSFDIEWLLPTPKIAKPARIRLYPEHIDYILMLNGGNASKVQWLVAQDANSKVLSYNEGIYSITVPCVAGYNFVRVLEYWRQFARIETVNINRPLPEALPVHLVHTWYAFKKGSAERPVYYMVDAEHGGIKYPVFYNNDSAWIQVKALKA